jgi:hypothetical protein
VNFITYRELLVSYPSKTTLWFLYPSQNEFNAVSIYAAIFRLLHERLLQGSLLKPGRWRDGSHGNGKSECENIPKIDFQTEFLFNEINYFPIT